MITWACLGYGLHDTFLIAKSVERGEDAFIWPITRVIGLTDPSLSLAPRPLPLQNAVNPYQILAEHSGLPVIDLFQSSPNSPILMAADGLSSQISQSVQSTITHIQPYPDIEGASFSEYEPQALLLGYVPEVDACQATGLMVLYYDHANPVSKLLQRIECREAGRLILSYISVIPQKP